MENIKSVNSIQSFQRSPEKCDITGSDSSVKLWTAPQRRGQWYPKGSAHNFLILPWSSTIPLMPSMCQYQLCLQRGLNVCQPWTTAASRCCQFSFYRYICLWVSFLFFSSSFWCLRTQVVSCLTSFLFLSLKKT